MYITDVNRWMGLCTSHESSSDSFAKHRGEKINIYSIINHTIADESAPVMAKTSQMLLNTENPYCQIKINCVWLNLQLLCLSQIWSTVEKLCGIQYYHEKLQKLCRFAGIFQSYFTISYGFFPPDKTAQNDELVPVLCSQLTYF